MLRTRSREVELRRIKAPSEDRPTDLRQAEAASAAFNKQLELVFDLQLRFVAGEIVEIEPPRHTHGVARNLGGERSRDSEVLAQLGVERRADEHRLTPKVLQGKPLI